MKIDFMEVNLKDRTMDRHNIIYVLVSMNTNLNTSEYIEILQICFHMNKTYSERLPKKIVNKVHSHSIMHLKVSVSNVQCIGYLRSLALCF